MNLSNVQWALSLGLLLLVVSEEPETPRQRAFDGLVLLLIGLTGPFVILFLPLLLWRLARRRTPWSAGLVVLAGVLAALQASELETARLEGGFEPSAVKWMMLVGRSFAGLLLLGDLPFAREASDVVLVTLSVGIYALFALHCVVERNATVAFLLAGGLAIFATTAYAYRSMPVGLALHIGVRYWYVPIVTLLWAASAALRSSMRPVAATSAAIWILASASTLSLFAAPRYTDFQWRAAVACAERRGACVVPINPPGFQIRLVSERARAREAQ
jgi:hypothetical protein